MLKQAVMLGFLVGEIHYIGQAWSAVHCIVGIKIGNKSFEKVKRFKYFGTTLTYQNRIHEEIKLRLKSGSACHHSLQRLFVFQFAIQKYKIYRTAVLPVVLYGGETSFLTLSEEREQRVFENRVLRRMFGPKGDEVIGEWRKLHNEEPYDMYSPPNIIRAIKSRRMGRAGNVARMGAWRDVYTILVGDA
jgi:hypothetical protein